MFMGGYFARARSSKRSGDAMRHRLVANLTLHSVCGIRRHLSNCDRDRTRIAAQMPIPSTIGASWWRQLTDKAGQTIALRCLSDPVHCAPHLPRADGCAVVTENATCGSTGANSLCDSCGTPPIAIGDERRGNFRGRAITTTKRVCSAVAVRMERS